MQCSDEVEILDARERNSEHRLRVAAKILAGGDWSDVLDFLDLEQGCEHRRKGVDYHEQSLAFLGLSHRAKSLTTHMR